MFLAENQLFIALETTEYAKPYTVHEKCTANKVILPNNLV